MKAKEDKMRQDAYLEQVYKERVAEKERNGADGETDDDEMDWDPIEDVLEDNRGSYLGMLIAALSPVPCPDVLDISAVVSLCCLHIFKPLKIKSRVKLTFHRSYPDVSLDGGLKRRCRKACSDGGSL
jgi:hypothetical protein